MLIVVLLILLGILFLVGGYEYLKVALAPKYNPETMQLNYEIIGSGPTKLVLLHGLAGSKNYWKKDLDSIGKTHKLLLIDLLGFGDSPMPNNDYSLSVQLSALEKIIKKEGFNDGKSIIGGHSMGAIISLALLEKHPNWFKTGVFISIPVYKDADEFKQSLSTSSFVDRVSGSKYSKYACMLHTILMTRPLKPDNLTDDVFEDAKKHTWQSYYYSLNDIVLKTDVFALANGIKDKEVLFIHGEKDNTAPLENALKLSREFKNAQIITSSEGDHQIFLKETDFVWQTIQDFSNLEENSKKAVSHEH
ncbi:alpha/beta hydrolase [Antarcticibacterium flavum]|uniref:Alpha/beta hydrolase n=2 Tax=Flavobacteriaceae TaxID=49546 RepID=A0A5B7X7M2_9FLAO|nr:alpha/beta hydrolase [Antarcticibacterium sp. W02-3]MCM4158481.1 alpha/beta hydrolase [Antarcticibacterium sp. W02-3]QCY71437.1 alpha/beta hydrolase [Antarcticibacterium flavum]